MEARARIRRRPVEGSEWKYVGVRRLAVLIEDSVYRGTRWVVFEPNNEALWSRIRSEVEGIMQDLFLKGRLKGTKPEQAYFVKCGRDTMTQADIESGRVNIVVGYAPLKPAEFLILKIRQVAGQKRRAKSPSGSRPRAAP